MLSALGFLKEARHCTISGHSRHIWSRATSSGLDSVKTFTATSSPVGLWTALNTDPNALKRELAEWSAQKKKLFNECAEKVL